jgi:hypothetical protein
MLWSKDFRTFPSALPPESDSLLEFDDTDHGRSEPSSSTDQIMEEDNELQEMLELLEDGPIDIEPTPINQGRMTIVDSYSLTNVGRFIPRDLRLMLTSCFRPIMPWVDSTSQIEGRIDMDHGEDSSGEGSLDLKLPARTSIVESPAKKPEFGKIWGYHHDIWQVKFEKLVEFRNNEGHCRVPHNWNEDLGLAQWCKRQRYQYKLLVEGKKSSMTPDRKNALDELGFIWNSNEAVWEERLADLQSFQQKYGHCNVPSDYPDSPPLAIWVKTMRRQYRLLWRGEQSSLTEERIARLERLGFEWDPRNLGTKGSF